MSHYCYKTESLSLSLGKDFVGRHEMLKGNTQDMNSYDASAG